MALLATRVVAVRDPGSGNAARDIPRRRRAKGGHVYCWKSIDQKAATDAQTGKSHDLPFEKAYFADFRPVLLMISAMVLQISAWLFSNGDHVVASSPEMRRMCWRNVANCCKRGRHVCSGEDGVA
jgi:hypothetical protein